MLLGCRATMGKTSSEWREAPGQTGLRKKQRKGLMPIRGLEGGKEKSTRTWDTEAWPGASTEVRAAAAADFSELSEVARTESEDIETRSRGLWIAGRRWQ